MRCLVYEVHVENVSAEMCPREKDYQIQGMICMAVTDALRARFNRDIDVVVIHRDSEAIELSRQEAS